MAGGIHDREEFAHGSLAEGEEAAGQTAGDYQRESAEKLIETLDEVRASADYEIFQVAEQDAAVIERIAAAQRAELEEQIAASQAEARAREEEIVELAGAAPF